MISRKKPGAAFWATVVVVVVLAYPLSFGPACWICSRTQKAVAGVGVIYHPLFWLWARGTSRTAGYISSYANCGAALHIFCQHRDVDQPTDDEVLTDRGPRPAESRFSPDEVLLFIIE